MVQLRLKFQQVKQWVKSRIEDADNIMFAQSNEAIYAAKD